MDLNKKVSVELYEQTEKRIYDIVTDFEDYVNKNNTSMENLAKTEFVEMMNEKFGIPKPEKLDLRAINHADIVHMSLLIFQLMNELGNDSTIDMETLWKVWVFMGKQDGIDFRP